MRRQAQILVMLVAVLLVVACHSGVSNKQLTTTRTDKLKEFRVKTFHGIEVSQGIHVVYSQAHGEPKVTAEGQPKALEALEVAVEDDELKVRYREGTENVNRLRTTVYVDAPDVNELEVMGGACIVLKKGLTLKEKLSIETDSGASLFGRPVRCKTLSVETGSGSSISLENIAAERVEAESNSGAIATLAGNCHAVSLEASSGAIINADELAAERGRAKATSGGNVKANVATRFAVEKSSGGAVTNAHAKN